MRVFTVMCSKLTSGQKTRTSLCRYICHFSRVRTSHVKQSHPPWSCMSPISLSLVKIRSSYWLSNSNISCIHPFLLSVKMFKQHVNIKCCVKLDEGSNENLETLKVMCGKAALDKSERWEGIKDSGRSGCPKTLRA